MKVSVAAVPALCSSKGWPDCTRQASCASSAIWWDWPIPTTFAAHLAPLRKTDWVVYAKPPFGGPEAVLAYLSRYTHRVAISNHRLISADADTVAFRWKDYRIKRGTG